MQTATRKGGMGRIDAQMSLFVLEHGTGERPKLTVILSVRAPRNVDGLDERSNARTSNRAANSLPNGGAISKQRLSAAGRLPINADAGKPDEEAISGLPDNPRLLNAGA
jgi:hypothetical protein